MKYTLTHVLTYAQFTGIGYECRGRSLRLFKMASGPYQAWRRIADVEVASRAVEVRTDMWKPLKFITSHSSDMLLFEAIPVNLRAVPL